jgi:hypothetical protein
LKIHSKYQDFDNNKLCIFLTHGTIIKEMSIIASEFYTSFSLLKGNGDPWAIMKKKSQIWFD